MSKPIVHYQMLISITTVVATLVYNYVVLPYQRRQDEQEACFQSLLDKIHILERSIDVLQRSIEDLEEKFDEKNDRVIESNTVLTSKLDDFINYSYDVCSSE